jgi:DNA polymerase/3'-5' exonuclease PolX
MTRVAHSQALPIAEALADKLAAYCERIEIAGSLRRLSASVGDIELVAIPKLDQTRNLVGEVIAERNLLLEHLDRLLEEGAIAKHIDSAGRPSWGEKARKFTVKTKLGRRFKVDLFTCTAETWGSSLLIRTGSRDFSHWIVTPQPRGAMPAGMHHARNRLWRSGEAVPLPEEADFFAVIGLEWIPPEERGEGRW